MSQLVTKFLTDNSVTNTKLAQSPTLTIKGNNTGGTANVSDLTVAQVNAVLPVFTSTLNGLVPLSGGGTTNFLRADGTWAPAGTGTVTSVALVDSTGLFNITGSPITTSGSLTLSSFQSQAQHTFFAAPSGGSGTPTFRAVVASDIPTLNQNTTGTASNITASSNSTLTTLTALSLPGSQVTGNISGNSANVTGTVVIANGGTGQSTKSSGFDALSPMTTGGDLIYGGASGTGTRLTNGLNGQVLTSSGGTSAPTWSSFTNGFAFFASSQITTRSTAITGTSFTTFSNSPAFTFTPSVTGSYKVYSAATLLNSPLTAIAGMVKIFNTTGGATLLFESQGVNFGAPATVQIISPTSPQSVYTLTSGTSYVFDLQGANSSAGGNIQLDGSLGPFYMFAELCG